MTQGKNSKLLGENNYMISKTEASYKFHDFLNVEFHSDEKKFYEFVNENFRFFRCPEQRSDELVVSVFTQNREHLRRLDHKIADNLFIDKNQLLYYNSGFTIHMMEEDQLKINAYIHKNLLSHILNFNERTVGIKWLRRFLYQKYMTAMRAALHLPLFYLLESKGFLLLHGSAVSRNGGGYLFLGAGGTGKTTLALDLVLNHGFKFLAEDFLIIKGDEVYAFPEKVRVSESFLKYSSMSSGGRFNFKIYNKYHIHLPKEKIASSTTCSRIFFTRISPEIKLDMIGLEEAAKHISLIHNYIREFPENSFLAFAPSFPSINEICSRRQIFLKNKETYHLHLSPNIQKNAEFIAHNENFK